MISYQFEIRGSLHVPIWRESWRDFLRPPAGLLLYYYCTTYVMYLGTAGHLERVSSRSGMVTHVRLGIEKSKDSSFIVCIYYIETSVYPQRLSSTFLGYFFRLRSLLTTTSTTLYHAYASFSRSCFDIGEGSGTSSIDNNNNNYNSTTHTERERNLSLLCVT